MIFIEILFIFIFIIKGNICNEQVIIFRLGLFLTYLYKELLEHYR